MSSKSCGNPVWLLTHFEQERHKGEKEAQNQRRKAQKEADAQILKGEIEAAEDFRQADG